MGIMSVARTVSFQDYLNAVDGQIRAGFMFGQIEDFINACAIGEEEKTALWLWAWRRQPETARGAFVNPGIFVFASQAAEDRRGGFAAPAVIRGDASLRGADNPPPVAQSPYAVHEHRIHISYGTATKTHLLSGPEHRKTKTKWLFGPPLRSHFQK
jgi:hypothetical protein